MHTLAEHEALKKNDAAWDALVWRPDWPFEDEILEQRDCTCGSTIARRKHVIKNQGALFPIGQAVHMVRFYKGMEHGFQLRGERAAEREAKRLAATLERKLLELCERKVR